jgi:hypothetical protein
MDKLPIKPTGGRTSAGSSQRRSENAAGIREILQSERTACLPEVLNRIAVRLGIPLGLADDRSPVGKRGEPPATERGAAWRP